MPESLLAAFNRFLTHPGQRWQRLRRGLRYALDLSTHCYRELIYDRADEMAAALTYRTIFSLIPIIVLSLLVFRAFVGMERARDALQNYVYSYLNFTALSLPEERRTTHTRPASQPVLVVPATLPATASTQPGAIVSTQPSKTVGGAPLIEEPDTGRVIRAQDMIEQLTSRIYRLNFKSIGAVGLLLFIWAAISLIVTVEQSFNR